MRWPEEEGIETPQSFQRWTFNVERWKRRPEEEGIETSPLPENGAVKNTKSEEVT